MGRKRTKRPQDYAENTKKGSAKVMGPPSTFSRGRFIRICRMTLWPALMLLFLEENIKGSTCQLPWEETVHDKLVASDVPQSGSGHGRANCMKQRKTAKAG